MEKVKLTEYSHGAGCGCKISPDKLESILESTQSSLSFPSLIVGNSSKDDSAAFDIGDNKLILSTTDFFMPIVDDPYIFGQIAATNAISDIYSMGGKPLMAISVLGWPIDKLSSDIAKEVIKGGVEACDLANIPLAGGHSIDSPEPIFGLCVTGITEKKYLKQNNMAKKDCEIFLTKPLGIGILSTAQKRKKIEPGHIDPAIKAMTTLNKIGEKISKLEGVCTITDVTGFGLMGHLLEICEGSKVSAVIDYAKVPLLPNTIKYLKMDCIPGGTRNNFKSYGHKLSKMTKEQEIVLCDAQTSGGLLVFVEKSSVSAFINLTKKEGLLLDSIGYTTDFDDKFVKVV